MLSPSPRIHCDDRFATALNLVNSCCETTAPPRCQLPAAPRTIPPRLCSPCLALTNTLPRPDSAREQIRPVSVPRRLRTITPAIGSIVSTPECPAPPLP